MVGIYVVNLLKMTEEEDFRKQCLILSTIAQVLIIPI